jgi:hypothetical protein
VNSVALGPIWTPLIPATMTAEKIGTFGQDTPIGRAGQPAEPGETIAVVGGRPFNWGFIFTRLGEGRRVSVNRLSSKLAAALMLPGSTRSRLVERCRRWTAFSEPRWSISTVMPY